MFNKKSLNMYLCFKYFKYRTNLNEEVNVLFNILSLIYSGHKLFNLNLYSKIDCMG